MFNENFSFGFAPHSPNVSANVEECTSADISPFTSRSQSPTTCKPAACRDSRFDAYRYAGAHRHSSITALTAQLQSQALDDTEMPSPSILPSEAGSPAESTPDTDADEGFYDGPGTPATAYSDYDEPAELDPTLWDLSMSDSLVATSSPRPSLSLEAQASSAYTMRRRQRQALIRLQCMVSRAPDLAMLIEECHPSSLPLGNDTYFGYGIHARDKRRSNREESKPVNCSGSKTPKDEKENTMNDNEIKFLRTQKCHTILAPYGQFSVIDLEPQEAGRRPLSIRLYGNCPAVAENVYSGSCRNGQLPLTGSICLGSEHSLRVVPYKNPAQESHAELSMRILTI